MNSQCSGNKPNRCRFLCGQQPRSRIRAHDLLPIEFLQAGTVLEEIRQPSALVRRSNAGPARAAATQLMLPLQEIANRTSRRLCDLVLVAFATLSSLIDKIIQVEFGPAALAQEARLFLYPGVESVS